MSGLEDELFKRFNALKAPAALPSSTKGYIQHRADRARKEDEELDAIADGRALPETSVITAAKDLKKEDEELERHIRDLRGGIVEKQEGEGEEGQDMGDEDVGSCKTVALM